jgi:hypothetical protein
MSTIQERTAQDNSLYFENERITKEIFEICHSLSLENKEGIDINLEEGSFKIAREDINYSGGITERYFLQKDGNSKYAEIISAGVYLDEDEIDNEKLVEDPENNQELFEELAKLTTYAHKLENTKKVLDLLKAIPEMI